MNAADYYSTHHFLTKRVEDVETMDWKCRLTQVIQPFIVKYGAGPVEAHVLSLTKNEKA